MVCLCLKPKCTPPPRCLLRVGRIEVESLGDPSLHEPLLADQPGPSAWPLSEKGRAVSMRTGTRSPTPQR
jgi:hypothetical protein